MPHILKPLKKLSLHSFCSFRLLDLENTKAPTERLHTNSTAAKNVRHDFSCTPRHIRGMRNQSLAGIISHHGTATRGNERITPRLSVVQPTLPHLPRGSASYKNYENMLQNFWPVRKTMNAKEYVGLPISLTWLLYLSVKQNAPKRMCLPLP